MIKRWKKIRDGFGMSVFLRTMLLFVGSWAMAAMDYFLFEQFYCLAIVVVGFAIGFYFRETIPDYYQKTIKYVGILAGILGIIVFLGERIGFDRSIGLIATTFVTVTIFDFQFWFLSDPQTVRNDD